MKRPWLLPLVPFYAAGWALKSGAFDRYPERARRLSDPVVSIGSLSAGGAGKTPFVIALGEALRRAGYGIDVLSRGYGRTSADDVRVRPAGTADEFGDEPLLIARRLACPVYVAQERFRAGKMAETDRHTSRGNRTISLHLLDDGFQHRQLARAVDIVLLTAEDVRDTLLPVGNLREPIRALRRANVVVLRHDEIAIVQPVLDSLFRTASMPHLWLTDRCSAIVEGTRSTRPFAFCGLARPQEFRKSLHALNVTLAAHMDLRDHQRYDGRIISNLVEDARRAHADSWITTAKDAVKLTPAHRTALQAIGPLAVCDVQVHLRNEQQCIASLINLVQHTRSATIDSVERRR